MSSLMSYSATGQAANMFQSCQITGPQNLQKITKTFSHISNLSHQKNIDTILIIIVQELLEIIIAKICLHAVATLLKKSTKQSSLTICSPKKGYNGEAYPFYFCDKKWQFCQMCCQGQTSFCHTQQLLHRIYNTFKANDLSF